MAGWKFDLGEIPSLCSEHKDKTQRAGQMMRYSGIGTVLFTAGFALGGGAHAQIAAAGVPGEQEQREADYRVVAARCGSPAFEKTFSAQSRNAVAAGLVSQRAEPAVIEKSIGSLRRSSLTLVATSSDCPAKLAQLADLQRSRQAALAAAGKRPSARLR